MIAKQTNQKAWFMVLPVFLVVAFSAVIPLMTVVNYSVQDTFGSNQFFWVGMDWFRELIHSERFHAAFLKQLLFSGIILLIEVPLGIVIALAMPKKGWGVPVCLITMALPLLIPWNVVGTIWQIFGRVDIGLLGHSLASLGFDYNYTQDPLAAWLTIIVMDVWHWTAWWSCSATPASAPFPMPTTRRQKSTGRRGGRCSAISSCRRCSGYC